MDIKTEFIKNNKLEQEYQKLQRKKVQLVIKRIFDIVFSLLLLILLFPLLVIISIIIKMDSSGPVLFKQIRITQYGKEFHILKFRTMFTDVKGSEVTRQNDERITRVGKIIRKYRLDELPQLLNILEGDMSFVGTRPEVKKYVNYYTNEMKVTLLLKAGVTSMASIKYKNEAELLNNCNDVDYTYIHEVLPNKMLINIYEYNNFSLYNDIKTIILTVIKVLR